MALGVSFPCQIKSTVAPDGERNGGATPSLRSLTSSLKLRKSGTRLRKAEPRPFSAKYLYGEVRQVFLPRHASGRSSPLRGSQSLRIDLDQREEQICVAIAGNRHAVTG